MVFMRNRRIIHVFRSAAFIIVLAVLIIALSEFLAQNNVSRANAQSKDSFSSLLKMLEDEIINSKVELFIRFVTPINGDEIEWIIPSYDTEGNYINRAISEVGEDYVCFDERFGEVLFKECTPFQISPP